ncbi:MAG: hypothetical protein ACKVT0_22140 [Planctomycetaceae bacterium]
MSDIQKVKLEHELLSVRFYVVGLIAQEFNIILADGPYIGLKASSHMSLKAYIVIVYATIGVTGCMSPATHGPSARTLSHTNTRAGSILFGKPFLPRCYFSWCGYDAFWDKIVVRDAASCNAKIAYRQYKKGNPGPYSTDFRNGFYKAHIDRANGYPARSPAVPPPSYWAACNRTQQGHLRAADWYAGYDAGLHMAETNFQHEYNVVPGAEVLAAEGIFSNPHVEQASHTDPSDMPLDPGYAPMAGPEYPGVESAEPF